MAKQGFIYTIEHVGVDGVVKSVEHVNNLMPTVALDYMLNAALKAGTQYSSWYIGLFTATHTPIAGDTMTTLLADCVEATQYGAARLAATFSAVSSGSVTTSASPTEFTFTSAATIRGGFITSGSVINNTSGVLLSLVQFASPKVMAAGEKLRVPVGIALADV